MNEHERQSVVDDYLSRLDRELSELPAGRRLEVVEGVREHIETAWDSAAAQDRVTLVSILDRLGEPELLAQEALVDSAADTRPVADRQSWPALLRNFIATLALAGLLVIFIFLVASSTLSAAVVGVFSLVVAAWGYSRRSRLGWGWVLVPAVLGSIWLVAAYNHATSVSSGDGQSIPVATPVNATRR